VKPSLLLVLFLSPAVACLSASCSSTPDEVRAREAEKTLKYSQYQEKRLIRAEARDERDEIWWNRVMGTDGP